MFKALDFRFIKHDYLLPVFATAIQIRSFSVDCGLTQRGSNNTVLYVFED
jgi:hypothetical protein